MNEEGDIHWISRRAWDKYNPRWLIDAVDEGIRADKIPAFNTAKVCDAYCAGFVAGVTYFITKEIPEVNE